MKQRLLFLFFCFAFSASAQVPFKQIVDKPVVNAKPFSPNKALTTTLCDARHTADFSPGTLSQPFLQSSICEGRITSSGSFWLSLRENDLLSRRSDISAMIEILLPHSVSKKDLFLTWQETISTVDTKDNEHIRVQQLLHGYPVLRQELILHTEGGMLSHVNGYAWTGMIPSSLPSVAESSLALDAAKSYLSSKGVSVVHHDLPGHVHSPDKIHLAWLPVKGSLQLVYAIELHPNALDKWTIHMDASTLEVVESYSQLCSLYPHKFYNPSGDRHVHPVLEKKNVPNSMSSLLDGPSMINDQDLLGQSRLVNGYQVNSTFYMIDASRNQMFDGAQSVMPDEPKGVIWTIDGQNGSPQKDGFELIHVSNTNNNWDPLEVSAHYNAGEAFEYFRQKFNRISLNGDGGNIISVINITDENGNGMDNAYWNGAAMFYGNGDFAFQPLAKSLDVAGHEMSHGVIQNTANLEYMNQSGALNESFADVFGAMIDREDWQLGEDVVNINVFPSGALRDLSNPNNGGNGPNDNGWQPKHMNEFQNLPNTPEGDNGGVHVNSGIPNRAFFLFATSIGKEKAEQVYYKALRDYLVKASQFIDLRLAVEKAASDLHGAGSAEVNAARSAFDAVGIGAGQGGDYEEDLETNEGDDFILATDESESDLYWIPPSNPNQFVKLEVPAPLSKPSFTDDGASCVYVDQENNMILINFDWSSGLSYQAFYLEGDPQGIWRNVVVSKDGSKIAYTTSQLVNEIGIYDFNSDQSTTFFLYNPTTAEGINTGDVLYADAMEWDYSGEYIMYDALNRIESSFGDGIEYWDISFINVWEYDGDFFTDGVIDKLYNNLPENISIGNPSFAKNSPYIITFDFVESYFDQFGSFQTDYYVLAANIQSGDVNEIYQNTTIGYPGYSREDDKILFTYDDFGSLLLATIDINPNDKLQAVSGTDVILITGAQKGVWFQTGSREFTSTDQLTIYPVSIQPQPAHEVIYLTWTGENPAAQFYISDSAGKIVLTGNCERYMPVDISALSPGTYFINGKTGNALFNSKLIKH